MITPSEFRVSTVFKNGGDILVVQRLQGTKSGRGAQVTKIRVKNLLTGQTMDMALNSSEKYDEVDLEEK